MGIGMVLLARVYAMIPLEQDSEFGDFDHALGMRYGASTFFFVMAAATIIIGYVALFSKKENTRKATSRLLAFLLQPWITFAVITIGVLWYLQLSNSDGDIAAFFASLQGIDVNTVVGQAHYEYIMRGTPYFEFMMVAAGLGLITPFAMYSNDMLLTVNDAFLIGKKRKILGPVERLHNQACQGLVGTAIACALFAAGSIAIGYFLGTGIDVLWPLFNLREYKVLVEVAPSILGSIGIFLAIASILHRIRPKQRFVRKMSWIAFIAELCIPIYGWFFALTLYKDLRLEKLENDQASSKI